MANHTDSERTTGSVGGTTAVALARVVVPLWLTMGAVLKLVDLSPTHLPAAMIKWCGALGIDLMFVLRFTIAAELVVAAGAAAVRVDAVEADLDGIAAGGPGKQV